MNENQTLLLVDDSEDDLSLMRHACHAARFRAQLQTVSSGEEAMAYLAGEGIYHDRRQFPLPVVMVLDLNMPRKNGFEVLSWLRTQPGLKRLVVIVLTASSRPEDVEMAFEAGTASYLVKPPTMAALIAMVCCLRDWLEYNHFPPLKPRPASDQT